MKTTVEISDPLFRRAKSEAALRGVKFKDLVEEGLLHVLEGKVEINEAEQMRLHKRMMSFCGIVDSGISDLATNPVHMEGFGEDH